MATDPNDYQSMLDEGGRLSMVTRDQIKDLEIHKCPVCEGRGQVADKVIYCWEFKYAAPAKVLATY